VANPQIENGHVDIANEIIEALAKIRLSGEEMQVLWVIFRKTYGWHKKQDSIPLSQFSEMTGLSRQHVLRAIKKLLPKKVIVVSKNGDSQTNVYEFNKDFEQWKMLPKKVTVSKNGYKVLPKKVTKLLPKKGHSKETTKETIQKKIYGEFVELSEDEYKKLKEKFLNVDQVIEFFNNKIGSKGLKAWRKDHASEYYTILNWDRQGWIKLDNIPVKGNITEADKIAIQRITEEYRRNHV
jgi:phage replication O-like protein O